MKIYKWSPKALEKFKGKLCETERIVFLGKNEVFSYNVTNNVLIDIIWYKTKDSMLTVTSESMPDTLYLQKSLARTHLPGNIELFKKHPVISGKVQELNKEKECT